MLLSPLRGLFSINFEKPTACAVGCILSPLRGYLWLPSAWKQMASGEEAFAEVAGYDFFFVANCCEIDAGIPVLQ
jgi:hypothetical protein